MQMRPSPQVLERGLASPSPQPPAQLSSGAWPLGCVLQLASGLCPAPGVAAVSELSLLVTISCGPRV